MAKPQKPHHSHKQYKTEKGERVYGIMAEFADPTAIIHGAEKVRDAGYKKWDVYSPFAVHGMDEAMGVKRTQLPLLVAAIALSVAGLGFFFEWWVSAKAFPLVVQGKPWGAWQPLIPITFEFGVLGTAFTSIIGMLAFNALPRFYHPLMKKDRFLGVSDDRYVICIEARDEKFDPKGTRKLLENAGALSVELVEE
jgi:hypothetical protein